MIVLNSLVRWKEGFRGRVKKRREIKERENKHGLRRQAPTLPQVSQSGVLDARTMS